QSDRRSFLAWAVTGLTAVFTAILGAPVVAYVTDPCRRRGNATDFQVVSGTSLDALQMLPVGVPTQGALRSVRRDAWTVHPTDVLVRVWIIRKREIPADFAGTDPTLLDVFTTICPH